MNNNISQSRIQIITNNLLNELVKADLISESNRINVTGTSEQNAYKMIKPYFEIMTENLSNHISKESFYDFLTEEIGLDLSEIEHLMNNGIIEEPEYIMEEER